MSWITRLANLIRPNRLSKKIEREMAFHIDAREQELVRAGRTPDAARLEARRRFGNVTTQRESAREHDIIEWLDGALTALARAWRSLKRTPGFLALAVCSLGIALGLATTTIAEIDALMHPYVPIRDAEHVYSIGFRIGDPQLQLQLTPEMALPLVRGSPLVESATAVGTGPRYGGGDLRGAQGLYVQPDFFDVLGLKPLKGRVFVPSDTAGPSIVITEETLGMVTQLGAEPEVGGVFSLGGVSYRLLGVIKRGMYPVMADPLIPAGARPIQNPVYVARVREGTSAADVQRAAQTIANALTERLPAGDKRVSTVIRSLQPNPLAINNLHRALAGAAMFVLLIACANVSALMLARSGARRREQALKIALGASKWDVIRDVVAEVVLIGLLGGIAGVVLADWAMRTMIALTPIEMRGFGFVDPRWDVRVFAKLFATVTATVALAALSPAFYLTGVQPAEPLKDGSPGTTGRPARRFKLLMVGELALAMVLLLGATLMTKSATRTAEYDFGFDARRVNAFAVATRGAPQIGGRMVSAPIADAERESIATTLRAMPELSDATWLAYGQAERRTVVSDATVGNDLAFYQPQVQLYRVGPSFIRALGIRIAEGRDFVAGDGAGDGAVILDSVAARQMFPNGNALGGLVKLGPASSLVPWSRVVGIVPPVTFQLPAVADVTPKPMIFVSAPAPRQEYFQFVFRAAPDVPDALPAAMGMLRSLLPTGTTAGGGEFVAGFAATLMARRLAAGMFVTLSIASLILATAGLFGVLSYMVSQRLREFAVRVALGANRPHIVRLVLKEGIVMALGGTALGGLLGLGAAFALYDWLWGVYPVDAVALTIAEGLLLAVTIGAAVIPALRAARANPLDVMRAI